MRQKFTLAMMLLCAILSGCTQTETSEESTDDTSSLVNLGDTLPAFSVTDNAGHVYSNGTLKGHISVIVFFNTTCPDCQHELPVIDSLYRIYQKQESFRLIAVSRAQDSASVSTYWQAQGFCMPYSAQPSRDIYQLFATQTIPRIYISNRNNTVISKFDDTQMPDITYLSKIISFSSISAVHCRR
jgi:peroxiredoxin